MKNIINGAIYDVNLKGVDASEFKGSHPAVIVRTLKEEKIFFVVPLTTYTKDRWDKAKKVGFGKRILSTNSIARIDKMKIIHSRDIGGRWVDKQTNSFIHMTVDELLTLSKKVDEYLALSEKKALNEYQKYITNYNEISNVIEEHSKNNLLKFTLERVNLKNISLGDIDNICKQYYSEKVCTITYKNPIYTITLT